MIVTLTDGSQLECDDDAFAEGGEGLLYWDKAGKYVIKLYKSVDPQREAALQKIIGQDYSIVLNEPYWDELFAWPKAIITQPKLGIIMLRAPKGTMELKWFLGQKQRNAIAQKHGEAKLGKWPNYLTMAIKMARVVRRMHFRGLCHSDLSFRNFLANPQAEELMLIDCDGLVVPGFLPPNVLGTPMCMAPELAAQITSQTANVPPSTRTDLHALSTLVYWLLLRRHPLLGPKVHTADAGLDEALSLGEKALFIEHPTDTSNHPPKLLPYTRLLSPAVQKLVERAFVQGLHDPTKRPSAADWERFLLRMQDALVTCENPLCPLGSFVLNIETRNFVCPCGKPMTKFSHVPILHFYQPKRGQKGHFQNDQSYIMVGQPDRNLYIWHADSAQAPGPGIDHQPKATLKFNYRGNKWHFKNIDFAEAHLLDPASKSQEISPGAQVELTDGVRLLLGPPDKCRLAYVEMVKITN